MPRKKEEKWIRFVYLPDVHGDNVNRDAWSVVMQFIEDFQPTRRVMGGDVMDLRPIRKGASAEERAESMEPDFDISMSLLRDVMPTDWCLGNHDDRLWDLARNDVGPLGDLGRYMVKRIETWCKSENIELYPYHIAKRCSLGSKLFATHGYFHGMHTAHKTAQTYPGCTLVGHRHSVDYYKAPSLDHREAYLCGCLCKTFQEYNKKRAATFQHVNGFAWGEYRESDGMFDVSIAQERFGEWRIGGKTYKPKGIK